MTLLEARGITVRFGGLTAVDAVSFDVPMGGFTGLIGPNGAGKTTTFNVISGFQEPTSGSVWFEDNDITAEPASTRAKRGIGRTFQKLELFGRMSVFDNMLAAVEAGASTVNVFADIFGLPKRHSEERRCGVIAHEMLEMLGLSWARDRRAADLPVGTARILELGRALCIKPRLLLLDEPSSGLDPDETRAFGELLQRVNSDMETAIVIVEHDMDLVMEVCTDVIVLDFGRLIARGGRDEIAANPLVRTAYLGEEDDAPAPASP